MIIKKLLLIISGIVISFIILEFVLQISGLALIAFKKYNNKKIKTHDTITVLCLGESTTDDQWPPILQQILNKKYPGKKFNVIDEGKAGTRSNLISTKIDKYFIEYEPDIVIMMIGINECGDLGFFVKKIKTISLFELIYKHIKFKYYNDKSIYNEKYGMAIDCIYDEKDYKKAEQILLDLVKKYEMTPEIFDALCEVYLWSDNMVKMENLFNNHNTVSINNILQFEKVYEKNYGKDSFEKWLINNEYRLCLDMKDFRTHDFLKKYTFLDMQKLRLNDKTKAQDYGTVKIQDRTVKNIFFQNYHAIINKIYTNNPKTIVFVMQYPMMPVDFLKNILKDSKYYEKLIFISNENNFNEALKTYKPEDLFTDMFAGSFGHCTDLGNTLIAENVAENIEKLTRYSLKK